MMNIKSIFLLLALTPLGQASPLPYIDHAELAGSRIEAAGNTIGLPIVQSKMGRRYQLQCSETLQLGSRINAGPEALGHGGSLTLSMLQDPTKPSRFYRLNLDMELLVDVGHMVFAP